ncbi:Uncharacterised protein [Mycobacteroides abscessus subsp. abscessus]|nr:Uncharacterised protein [Mycobacteroides abscessus subsp. abscessus]
MAARCRNTASPDFMSTVPQPCRTSPSCLLGTLSAAGTVSRCPASMTRVPSPLFVRASTALPLRMTSKPLVCSRSATSTASAIWAS